MNFTNLTKYSTNVSDYADQQNPELNAELAEKLNAQAERLEWLFLEICTRPDHKEVTYKDILPWRQRVAFMKSKGERRAALRLQKQMAYEEAKKADEDEEFMTGYKEFLDSEFVVS